MDHPKIPTHTISAGMAGVLEAFPLADHRIEPLAFSLDDEPDGRPSQRQSANSGPVSRHQSGSSKNGAPQEPKEMP
jgi:hypothetical protein